MSDISDVLKSVCIDAKDTLCNQAADLIKTCQKDETQFLRGIGQQTETAVQNLAAGKIDPDMFKDLLNDALSLQKIEAAKLSVQSKVRVQQTVDMLRKVLIDGICTFLK